jgi:hypothetical protein
MGAHAGFQFDLECPRCGQVLVDVVWFAWGGLLSYDFSGGPLYLPGDHILWFAGADGTVRGDRSWRDARGRNVGDPTAMNVDVYEINGIPSKCPDCALSIEASVVSVRRGKVAEARVVVDGPIDVDLHALIFDEDGNILTKHLNSSSMRQMEDD